MRKKLTELGSGKKGEIVSIEGGVGFKRKIKNRGVRIGKNVKIITRQPRGPLVVNVGEFQMTIGRGMAEKIIVEA